MIKKIITYFGAASFIFICIYFMSVLAKEVSYRMFYEDKVKETIRGIIKPEFLNQHSFNTIITKEATVKENNSEPERIEKLSVEFNHHVAFNYVVPAPDT